MPSILSRLAILCVLFLPAEALAHKSSDSFLNLKSDGEVIVGQWDIALRDMDLAVGLDLNGDGALTWGELRGARLAIEAYALSRLTLSRGQTACEASVTDLLVSEYSDGPYAALIMEAHCSEGLGPVQLSYNLLFDQDANHRGILQWSASENATHLVIGPDTGPLLLEAEKIDPAQAFISFLAEGVWHIWIGFDHILFLLTLLLPVALVRRHGTWELVSWLQSLVSAAKVVTAFTIAHSLTLGLAVYDLVLLPARFVEPAIALSVALAAANNVFPVVTKRHWIMAFAFGLIHGFGFAVVLLDISSSPNVLAWTLLAFNLGVELGQLAILALAVPVVYILSETSWYRSAGIKMASIAVIALSSIWMFERTIAQTL
ncbi:MAG: HupE/UreJ family protein [Pseudomonadota bacterium]